MENFQEWELELSTTMSTSRFLRLRFRLCGSVIFGDYLRIFEIFWIFVFQICELQEKYKEMPKILKKKILKNEVPEILNFSSQFAHFFVQLVKIRIWLLRLMTTSGRLIAPVTMLGSMSWPALFCFWLILAHRSQSCSVLICWCFWLAFHFVTILTLFFLKKPFLWSKSYHVVV